MWFLSEKGVPVSSVFPWYETHYSRVPYYISFSYVPCCIPFCTWINVFKPLWPSVPSSPHPPNTLGGPRYFSSEEFGTHMLGRLRWTKKVRDLKHVIKCQLLLYVLILLSISFFVLTLFWFSEERCMVQLLRKFQKNEETCTCLNPCQYVFNSYLYFYCLQNWQLNLRCGSYNAFRPDDNKTYGMERRICIKPKFWPSLGSKH